VFVPTAAVVVEVVSPGDRTDEEFGFSAAHGVGEIVVADPHSGGSSAGSGRARVPPGRTQCADRAECGGGGASRRLAVTAEQQHGATRVRAGKMPVRKEN
jgi:hypothetical protein